MKLRMILALLCIVAVSAPSAFAAGGELDGKTFKGSIGTPGEKGDPDTFIFKSGTFRSTACDEYGYGTAPYKIETKDGVKSFTATTTNKNGATMVWGGVVNGNTIEGNAIMTTSSGEKTPMSFSGKLN